MGVSPMTRGCCPQIRHDPLARHTDAYPGEPRSLHRGKRVLVYDDVCTTGNTLDAMAGYLIDAGAAEVTAVVMARVPWRPVPAPPQTAT